MKGTFTQSLFFTLLRASLVLLSGLLLWLASSATLDVHIQPITVPTTLLVIGSIFFLFYPVLRPFLRRLQRGDDADGYKLSYPLVTLFMLAGILSCSTIQAQVTGSVFRDFDGDGTKDANEPLVSGVLVSAYLANSNTPCGTATSSGTTAPNYSVSGCGTAAVRVEFEIPTTGTCANSTIDFSSLGGTTYGSSVQFVNGNSTNVNFAIHNPNDYNTGAANTSAYIPRYVNGDPLPMGSAAGSESWFYGFGYNTTGDPSTPPTQSVSGAVLGSTWGVAYSKQAKKIFVAAFIKRHVGLGSLGSGGIYLLEPTATSFNVSTFYNMDANGYRTRANETDPATPAYGSGTSYSITSNSVITFSGAPDPLSGQSIGLGVVGSNADRNLSTNPIIPGYDPAAFDQTGKVGLGDIDISDDGQYLFVMNLYSRRVFRLRLNNPANPTSVTEVVSYAVPDPGCTNGTYRPFGLKFYRNKLYVGVVCSAENIGSTNANLSARVYELNDPTAAAAFNATAVVTISDMTYDRQTSADWKPWSNNSDRGSSPIRYSQPILSDIEVNERGDMIMAFMDRAGNQYGNDNYKFLQTSPATTDNHSAGEILIAGVDCSTGSFTVENNGQFTSSGVPFASNHAGTAPTTQGIGGREFFDDYSPANDPHAETTQGAVALLMGTGEVMSSSFAIIPVLASDAGVSRFSCNNGTYVSGYALYGGSSGNFFGKAAGLGDLELSGVTSPIEIGNRVWMDTDNDGIQDAGEMGLGSIPVKLYQGATQVGATNTATDGSYYFNNSNVNMNGATGLLPNTAYVIRVEAADFPSGKSLSSNQNIGGAGQPDVRDNDAALNGGNAEIAVTTGKYGENNHTLDMAFKQCTTPTATAAAAQPTCSGGVAQSNGTITLSGFTAGQRYQYSSGATFNSGAATPASITAIPVGGVITSTLPNTTQQYTVRIYDATDDACFVDRVVSITAVTCGTPPTCACKEYVYVNEVNFSVAGRVHKFEVGSGSGALSEVLNGGGPWYPGAGTSQLIFPHGLGADRNGFLYIGTTVFSPNTIRRLDCTGDIKPTFASDPVNGFNTANAGNGLYNIDSYDGFIYSNGEQDRIYKWDPCTGALIGYIQLGDGGDDWGFSIDNNGKFYVTNMNGKIWFFTPTAANFIANTTFPANIELNANPSLGGLLSPSYAGQGLGGITVDNSGNIYVVEGNRDGFNTPSRLLKFTSAGGFLAAGPIDNVGNDGAGWSQMVGVVYSSTSNKLYTTSLNSNQDCVYRWNTNLTADAPAIGPVPGLQMAKGIAILSECCPTSGTVDISSCSATIGDKVSLSDLLPCDGVICDGRWTLSPGSTNFTYNNCDVTATPTGLPACATLTLTNTSTPNAPCAAYTITVNTSLLGTVTAQQIAGNQTVCPTDNPAAFTLTSAASTTPPGATILYQWQSSTTSCMAGFTNIPGANMATYDPGPVSQTTYYRVIASIEGCASGVCENISNCVTLTLNASCPPICNFTTTSTTPLCHGNGTPEDASDDYITFTVNIANSLQGSLNYTVTATQGGNPIVITLANGSPATAVNCNLNTPLRTPAGTAGDGPIVLTITDNVHSCITTMNIVDPGSCAVTCVSGTPSMVMYSYRTEMLLTDLNNVPLLIPRFNTQGGTRTLTSVKLDYEMGFTTALLAENAAATPVTNYEYSSTSDGEIILNATPIATPSLSINSPTVSFPAGISVPAQGTWPGDGAFTLAGMLPWIQTERINLFKDPTIDTRWVTNATGNPLHDDDIRYFPPASDVEMGSITYTMPVDLSNFTGVGNVPLTASTLTGLSTFGGGGNIQTMQSTKAYAYAKVTYTYDCAPLCALNPADLTIPSLTFGSGFPPVSETVTINGGANLLPESNIGGFYGAATSEGTLYSFCTEINQPLLPLQNPYTHIYNGAANGFTAAIALRIAQVVQAAGFNSTTGFGAGNNTTANFVALQLAVWNAIYDTDYSVSNGAGTFYSTTNANGALATANGWLTAAQAITAPTVVVHNLHNATGQDLLKVGNPPATITLAVTAPTCAGAGAPNNAGITISNFTNQRYRYSSGTAFNAGSAIPASITAIPVGGVIATTLPNTSLNYTVRIYDATDDNCYVDQVVTVTAVNCCALTAATKTFETCNSNGTIGDGTDDYITFSLNPTGTGLGASYSVTANNGGTVTLAAGGAATGIAYGSVTAFRLQNGSSNGTLYTITVTDVSGAPCVATTTVQQNTTCSAPPPCALTAITFANPSPCNNNGTNVSGVDDYFTADITVTFSNPPATGNLVLTGDVLVGGGASVVTVATAGAGPTYTFVGVRLRADGTASSVTATFSADNACTFSVTNGPNVPSCSSCVAPVLATNTGTVCTGNSISLASLVTSNSPAGVLTFYTSQSDANAATNVLVNSTVAPVANTTYYVRSETALNCFSTASVSVTVATSLVPTVTNGSVCAGGSIDLASLVTNSGGGTLSFYTTQADANAGTNALGSSTVSPTTATNYYVRSTAGGCYGVKEITVNIAPVACVTPTVTGPN